MKEVEDVRAVAEHLRGRGMEVLSWAMRVRWADAAGMSAV